ncbi:MAG: hypothetical protein WBZ29_09585, partial [Methanocella sp.]
MKGNKKGLPISHMGHIGVHCHIFIVLVLLAMLFMASWSPVQASVPRITEIKQGATASMAVDENGKLWCWGSNFDGECGIEPVSGNKSTYYIVTPTRVKGISNVIGMDEGTHWFVVALDKNHNVWTWGDNSYRTLGRDVKADPPYTVPEMVPRLVRVKTVTTGDDFCTVLLENGTVWSWGRNEGAQLGDGTVYTYPVDDSMNRSDPGMVINLSDIKDISSGNRNVIAITNDGEPWIWGFGSVYLMGDYGKTHYSALMAYSRVSTPVHLENLHDIDSVAVGLYFAVALKEDGTVWTWGSNYCGQLGTGKLDDSYDPVPVQGLSDIIQVSAGTEHALALSKDGTVWSWGRSQYGQVGDGTTTDRDSPVKLDLPKIVSISAKGDNSMALDVDGNVWTWGSNNFGELGNGEYVMDGYRTVPEKVTFPDFADEDPGTAPDNSTGVTGSSPTPMPTSTVTPTLTPEPT